MPLNGRKNLIISFLTLSVVFVRAEDFGIALPDQLQGEERVLEQEQKEKEDAGIPNLIMGDRDSDENIKDLDSESFVFPKTLELENKKLDENKTYNGFGNTLPFSHDRSESLVEFKNNDTFKKFYNSANTSFSLTYINDEYKVSDSRNIFKNTIENSDKAKRLGAIHINYDDYVTKGWLNLYYGFGVGIGYWEAEGKFESSSDLESDVIIKHHYVPLDLRLGFDFNLSRFFKLSFGGGPSLMGLSQSRSDKERDSGERYRRQVSYGRFGNAKFQLSLSSLFNSLAFKTMTQYEASNIFLNIEARHHHYENFQDDDISVSGESFGIGFSFEYL